MDADKTPPQNHSEVSSEPAEGDLHFAGGEPYAPSPGNPLFTTLCERNHIAISSGGASSKQMEQRMYSVYILASRSLTFDRSEA